MNNLFDLRKYITGYRLINLLIFGPYSIYFGYIYNDPILIIIGLLILVVDTMLLWYKTTNENILQPFRFLGSMAGIYWLYASYIHNNKILLAMGTLQAFTDSALFLGY